MTTITHPQHDAHVVDQLADRLNRMIRARAAAKLPRYRTVLARQFRLVVSNAVELTGLGCMLAGVVCFVTLVGAVR